MNKKILSENLSLLMTGVIFVGLGFVAGYAVSDFFMKDTIPPAAAVSVTETAPPVVYTPVPVITPQPEYFQTNYIVKTAEGELILYEVDGADKKVLRKSKINVNSFPPSDAIDLKNGINADSLEGALQIWESFIE